VRTLDQVLAAHPLPFTLSEIQIEDINRMAALGRCLGDEPVGSGKTVMGTYAALMHEPDVVVVLVPPILIAQWCRWLRELKDVGPVLAYEGGPAARKLFKLVQYRWIVVSYGMFRNDFERFMSDLSGRRAYLIVDEAQNTKNHNSKLYECSRDFAFGRHVLQLSGTPLTTPGDSYSYIKLHNPHLYATFRQFTNIHVEKWDYFNNPEKWCNLELMQENYNKARVHRTKEEVHAALPRANYLPIFYDLDPEHMKLYKKLMEEQLLEVPDGQIDASTAQKLQHHAQQIICNYGLFAGDPTKRSRVFDLIDEMCDEIGLGLPADAALDQPEASKVIIWTQYKMTSALIHAYMQSKQRAKGEAPYGKAVAAYSGADSKASVEAFMFDPDTTNLTANTQSAGAGLNAQGVCWECAFPEFPTSTVQFRQAAGRIDRIGQRFNPNIRIFVARGTIQESKLKDLLSNDELVQEVSGDKQALKNLIFPK
jgi:SNF2 family DNA or RNA helicase